MSQAMPYWRLSNFYLFYFAALGVLVPYWGLYLKQLGFEPVEIGALMAIPMATKFVAPFVWGWLGDRLQQRMSIVRLGALLTALVFGAVFWTTSFAALALVMVLFSFFWNAILPQFEAVTLNYLGEQATRYARVRVWGSIGFIFTVLVLGVLVDRQGPQVVLPVLLFIYCGIWLSSLSIRDPRAEGEELESGSILTLLRQPHVLAFLVICFLLQAGHGAYYAFYSIYLEQAGYSKTLIGQLWALGVVAEVLVFLVMHRLLLRFGALRVMQVSLMLAALRWLLIGSFVDWLPVLFLAQTLHAATFGTFHASAIHLVHRYFRGRHQGRGQALYSSVSFGLGGALGSLVSGLLWKTAGGEMSFYLATVVSLMAVAVSLRWGRDPG